MSVLKCMVFVIMSTLIVRINSKDITLIVPTPSSILNEPGVDVALRHLKGHKEFLKNHRFLNPFYVSLYFPQTKQHTGFKLKKIVFLCKRSNENLM